MKPAGEGSTILVSDSEGVKLIRKVVLSRFELTMPAHHSYPMNNDHSGILKLAEV